MMKYCEDVLVEYTMTDGEIKEEGTVVLDCANMVGHFNLKDVTIINSIIINNTIRPIKLENMTITDSILYLDQDCSNSVIIETLSEGEFFHNISVYEGKIESTDFKRTFNIMELENE